ncbi:hypothetical protein [uncultured Draconibacterium sp.]|uniref:hypothetical protein n=1 Tax=uncultured Draconibacterium sp. TaxID=1573823 RepID=UPI0029C7C99F|nr:hypothetical protein [uncultured Draconibacterium sp.]
MVNLFMVIKMKLLKSQKKSSAAQQQYFAAGVQVLSGLFIQMLLKIIPGITQDHLENQS